MIKGKKNTTHSLFISAMADQIRHLAVFGGGSASMTDCVAATSIVKDVGSGLPIPYAVARYVGRGMGIPDSATGDLVGRCWLELKRREKKYGSGATPSKMTPEIFIGRLIWRMRLRLLDMFRKQKAHPMVGFDEADWCLSSSMSYTEGSGRLCGKDELEKVCGVIAHVVCQGVGEKGFSELMLSCLAEGISLTQSSIAGEVFGDEKFQHKVSRRMKEARNDPLVNELGY